MRDLARALSNIKLFDYDESFVAVCDEQGGMLSFPLGLVYEAIERAIKAEAEVARLTKINQECESEAHLYDYLLHRCRTENARLRKVVDAARDLPCPIWEHSNPVEDKLWDTFITALTELDKEGE